MSQVKTHRPKYRVVRDLDGWGVTDCPDWQKIPILENAEPMTKAEAEAMVEELNQSASRPADENPLWENPESGADNGKRP